MNKYILKKSEFLISMKLFFLFFLSLYQSLFAQNCVNVVEDAFEYLKIENYNEVITILTDCPPGKISDISKKTLSYELLSFAYYKTNQPDSLINTLNRLLDESPNYSLNPSEYPENFIEYLDTLKEERLPLYKKTWFWIGSAAMMTFAILLLSQDKNSKNKENLPAAPGPPFE